MNHLEIIGHDLGQLLKDRGESVGVAESSTGGLVSATLLSVPGASRYYAGGAVVYTTNSRRRLFGLSREDVVGLEPLSVEIAAVFAARARETFDSTWGIAELGAAGPTGTGYGHPAGVCVVAVNGPVSMAEEFRTGSSVREDNMWEFTRKALDLLSRAIRSA